MVIRGTTFGRFCVAVVVGDVAGGICCGKSFFWERSCCARIFTDGNIDIPCDADEPFDAMTACNVPSSSVISFFVVEAYPSSRIKEPWFNESSGISW